MFGGGVRVAPNASATAKKMGASTTLTSGPATAIFTSSKGFSGRFLRRASPPMGRRVMSGTSMPSLWATSAWPNSCRSTHTKSAMMIPTATTPLRTLPVPW